MNIKKIILIITLILPSCSVFMAANKKGVDISELSQCSTRNCLIAKGAEPIGRKNNTETFKAQKPTGSVARAAMHGVLDVATLGIWEAAGTPIEASVNKKEMYVFKVSYKGTSESISHVEIER